MKAANSVTLSPTPMARYLIIPICWFAASSATARLKRDLSRRAGIATNFSILCATARFFRFLHLNGYKIANPTVLARLSDEKLTQLFCGYGYKPHFVDGHDPQAMHQLMAQTMDTVLDEIHAIQHRKREAKKGPGCRRGR